MMPLPRTPLKEAESGETSHQLHLQQTAVPEAEPGTSSQTFPLTEGNGQKPDLEISAAREIRLPPFWKSNPSLWFAQCECAFHLGRITADETRFRHVVVNLDHTILPYVSDLLLRPPVSEKYLALKSRILQTFGDSVESKLRRLLRENDYRDEKPSLFLHRLRNLADGQCSDAILKTIFLEQLPESMRSILSISEVADLSKLALQADKIAEVTLPSVALVDESACLVSKDSSYPSLLDAIKALSIKVDRLRLAQGNRPRRERSSSSGRRLTGRSPAADFKQKVDVQLCFYHKRFGVKARRCVSPCTWVQQGKPEHQEN